MTDDGRVPEAPGAAAPTLPIRDLCPYLLSADGGWRSSTAAREHRCTAVRPPAPLAAEKQRRLCLTSEHISCATYLAADEARGRVPDEDARRRPFARTTPLVLDQGRLAVPIPSISASSGMGQGILIGLLGLAFAAVLIAQLASGGGSRSGAIVPIASSTPAATDGAVATDAAETEEPTVEATDEPNTEASPTLVPTEVDPTPDAPADTAKTYKIKKGDTLSGIAATYGTTVKKLVKLNKISDPSKIRVGQVLQLP